MSLLPRRDYALLLLGDLFVFVLSLWLTLWVRYFDAPSWFDFTLHLFPFSLLFAVWLIVFFLAGLYDRHTSILRTNLSERIFYSQALNTAIAALFFFFVPYFGIAPKTILFIYLFISSPLIYIWRVYVFPRTLRPGKSAAALLGGGGDVEDLRREINGDHWYPFEFVAFIDTGRAAADRLAREVSEMNGPGGPTIIVADTADPAIATALPAVYDAALQRPGFLFLDVYELYEAVFERVPLTLIRPSTILTDLHRPLLYDVVKRGMDIIIAMVGCLALAALYPVIALAIRLEDGGKVIVTQERVGRYQRPIRIYKFRSMSGVDRGGEALKSKHRITRVGRVLRRLHLDEFPQFLSLLRGDLSFVGPRPELPVLAAHYAAEIPFYHLRHLVKPGLSGWARVRHRRAPHHAADVSETRRKLGYDLYYLTHRSLRLDLYVILQTVRFIVTARGS